MAARTPLAIDLLGGFAVRPAEAASARSPSARQQQVVAFLVLHAREAPVPRQRVAGSLWPESTDDQALTNLRRELHHLRESWPAVDAHIDAASRTLAWRDGADLVVDLPAFETAAARGLGGDREALARAANLYKGDLLPEASGDWIDADRERLRQRAREVLVRLVAQLEADRAFGDAIERAQQLLRLDRLDEQAWCALMRSHARRGDRATALHVYQQCAALLKDELGVGPSAATRLTYRQILERDEEPETAVEPPTTTGVYPLVGRQPEWHALVGAWRHAATSGLRLALIRGEAGIGKTRLAEELVEWARMNGVASASARCYAGEGQLAYAPIASWLKADGLRPALMQLDAAWMTDVARLRPELLAERPDVPPPDRRLESWQRLRFFQALAQAFRSAAPLLLVIDDVQWADGDTLEWIQYFVRAAADARSLVVATVRAEEQADNPALVRLLGQLERDGALTPIALGPLDRTATAQLAGEVAGRALDETALARTFRETEGHPLFIIERGRMDAGREPGADARPLPQVQAVVAARLALLSEDARAVAEVASAVGRDFAFDVLAQASDLEEDALVRALDELWRRHIVRAQAGESWDFGHDRIREVAYAGMGPARRRLVHRRIAQALEVLFADRLDDVSASIAAHLDRGGQPVRAIPFLERAAAVATCVSATEEAIRCLTHAVALVDRLPAGHERDDRELALRATLSGALNTGRGYAAPEIEANLDRVFALLRARDVDPVPVRWLWVASTMRFMLGDLATMRVVSEQALAASVVDPTGRCEANLAMGGLLLSLGRIRESQQYFEAALAAYDDSRPQRALGSDLGVFTHAWYSHALWLLGEEDAAMAHAAEGIALAERRDHLYSQTIAHAYAALMHQMRGDVERAVRSSEEVIARCDRYGFGYYGEWARILTGWARGLERPAEGVRIIEAALERLDQQRAQARRPFYLSLLADTCARLGDTRRTAEILDRAIAMSLERDDVWWLPALYLQKSGLAESGARDALRADALRLSRAHGSRGLEKRLLEGSIASAG